MMEADRQVKSRLAGGWVNDTLKHLDVMFEICDRFVTHSKCLFSLLALLLFGRLPPECRHSLAVGSSRVPTKLLCLLEHSSRAQTQPQYSYSCALISEVWSTGGSDQHKEVVNNYETSKPCYTRSSCYYYWLKTCGEQYLTNLFLLLVIDPNLDHVLFNTTVLCVQVCFDC